MCANKASHCHAEHRGGEVCVSLSGEQQEVAERVVTEREQVGMHTLRLVRELAMI